MTGGMRRVDDGRGDYDQAGLVRDEERDEGSACVDVLEHCVIQH